MGDAVSEERFTVRPDETVPGVNFLQPNERFVLCRKHQARGQNQDEYEAAFHELWMRTRGMED
jgi:hypothetical protein